MTEQQLKNFLTTLFEAPLNDPELSDEILREAGYDPKEVEERGRKFLDSLSQKMTLQGECVRTHIASDEESDTEGVILSVFIDKEVYIKANINPLYKHFQLKEIEE